MKHTIKSLLSLTAVIAATGCNDFLSGPGIDQDPNSILNLTRPGPLYIGIQAAQSVQFEGQMPGSPRSTPSRSRETRGRASGSTATAWTR